jgi:hypothetical protein
VFLPPIGLSVMAVRFGNLRNETYMHTHGVVPCEQSKCHKESNCACEVVLYTQVATRQLPIRERMHHRGSTHKGPGSSFY